MSLCIITRFRNERHIMYEWIHHHLEEGIDKIFMIDHLSDDQFLEHNPWMHELILQNKVEILETTVESQFDDYDFHLKKIRKFEWVIQIDIDEFIYSSDQKKSLKQVLNDSFKSVDYFKIKWKLFAHQDVYQPKSVIENCITTHEEAIDPSSPCGIKCLARTKYLKSISIHEMKFKKNKKIHALCLLSHNQIIEINHYRMQSDEYLYGVKEQRGSGVHKDSYKQGIRIDLQSQLVRNFSMKDNSLAQKRSGLIEKLNHREQVKPQPYINSTWLLSPVSKGGI
ncbi:MAG: glycosyltransferase family 2 protein [Akkermansiaceae bacterium]